MKRFVLVVVGVLIVSGAYARITNIASINPHKHSRAAFPNAATAKTALPMTEMKDAQNAVQSARHGSESVLHVGDSVGRTWWDLQAVNCVPNHALNFQSGIGSIIGLGRSSLTSTDIGPYYGVNDGSAFKPLGPGGSTRWARITTDDRLYSAMAAFDDQKEVVISQSANPSTGSVPLVCLVDSQALEGKWTATPMAGTNGGYLPVVAVSDSNHIHVMYCTINTGEPITLWYTKSTDLGQTWSAPDTIATYVEAGAYSITARGGNVALVWNKWGYVGSLISLDNGNRFNFTGYLAYLGNYSGFTQKPAGHDTTAYFVTRDTLNWGNHLDALIDETGLLHVVAHPMWVHLDSVVISGNFAGIHLRSGGLISINGQNQDMPDSLNGFFYYAIDTSGQLQNPSRMGPVQGDPFGAFTFAEIQQFYTLSGEEMYVGWPQLGYNPSTHMLYCVYGSYDKNDVDVLTAGSRQYPIMFSHVYGTTSQVPSNGWTFPSKISADGTDAEYPSLADFVDDHVVITYQGDYHAGTYTNYRLAQQTPPFTPFANAIVGLSAPATKLTAVNDLNAAMPQGFALGQNYPNPFNPTTRIAYSLDKAADVHLEVFDILGRSVANLAAGKQDAGIHTATFDATHLQSGVYTYTLTAGSQHATRTMVLTK